MGVLSAPAPPGALGRPADASALLVYLSALDGWLAARRAELDGLPLTPDGTPGGSAPTPAMLSPAVRSPAVPSPSTPHPTVPNSSVPGPSVTGPTAALPSEVAPALPDGSRQSARDDLVLAMGLWQTARVRCDELTRVWDSGRADAVDRERISAMIWGRLGTGTGAGTLSLVEVTRLCDALTDQLREQLQVDPAAVDELTRRRGLRAALVRCQDLAGTEPEPAARVAALVARLGVVGAQAERGADVTGRLHELEVDVAVAERDLMIAASARQRLAQDRARALGLQQSLAAAEPAVRDLAARARAEIAAPPRLAVPDVARLGDPPTDADALTAHLHRLARVEQALAEAREAYAAPLRQRAALRYTLRSAAQRAEANGRAATPVATAAWQEASAAVEAAPCDLRLATALVEQYELVTRDLPRSAPAPGSGTTHEGVAS